MDIRPGSSDRKKARPLILRTLFCFLALWFCGSQGLCPAAGTLVELSGEAGRIDLGRHVSVLRDSDGTMTIEDVTVPPTVRQFAPNKTDPVKVTGEPGKTWVRFRLRDPAPKTTREIRWVLEINCSVVDVVELYVPDPGRACCSIPLPEAC